MRKLVLKMSVSLDGFVGGPDGEVEWAFDSIDEAARAWLVDTLWQAGLHVMGRRTFDDMAAHWPTSEEPYAAPMNAIPKLVFSRRGAAGIARALASRDRDPGAWTDVPVAADLAATIAELKRQPGKDLLAHGGAGLARGLIALDLVDEYRLLVHPVALGRGLPIFSERERPLRLTTTSVTPFPGGAVAHVLRPVR